MFGNWVELDAWRTGSVLLGCKLPQITVMQKQKLSQDQHSGCQRVLNEWRWCAHVCVCDADRATVDLCCCNGLTALALIQGDTQPSNLLSAQFQWTMEFRARRYTILLSALRLAARLMRLRLPTGEPNGVKTKVLLWTTNPSQLYHTERLWLVANMLSLTREYI